MTSGGRAPDHAGDVLRVAPVRPAQQYRMIVWIATIAFLVSACLLTAIFPGPLTAVLTASWLLRTAFVWLQWRDIRIDRRGVRRQSALWATPWGRVESFLQPKTARSGLRLRVTGGKVLATGIPIEHAQAVHQLSGKPLLRDD